MARAVGGVFRTAARGVNKLNPHRLAGHSGLADFLDPGGKVTMNIAEGKPITTRNLLDPSNVILHAPLAAPPPPPTFPDVAGAQINARRAVRRRSVEGGLGSTVLTGGYSPTGQASSVLGGG